MAHLIDSQLRRFQLEPEVHDLAKSLLHTAQLKTAPGSGHELDHGAAALPAICAYIACKQLNSTDVDWKTAQTASCIRSLVFKKALETVESVLEINSSSTTNTTKAASISSRSLAEGAYNSLLRTHKFRKHTDVLLSSLLEAEKALLSSGELRGSELKVLKDGKLLRCAVFGWTCDIFKAQNVSHKDIRERYDLKEDLYAELILVMDSACSHVADDIRQRRECMKRQKNQATPSQILPTPSSSSIKSHYTRSPTKSLLKRSSSIFIPLNQSTPTKRKVTFPQEIQEGIDVDEDEGDGDGDILESITNTPSNKKAKLTFPTPSGSSSLQKLGMLSVPKASSSRVTLERMAVDEVDSSLSQMQTQSTLLPLPYSSTAFPTTPRRTRNSSSPTKRTPTTPISKSLYASFTEDEDLGGPPQPARFRSTYLDHKQWVSRDPRVEQEIKKGEEMKTKFIRVYGASVIERYRPVTVG